MTDDVAAWDEAAETYAAMADVDWFDDFLDRHLADVAGKRVLDLGCGTGWFAQRLQERGADVLAVDGSARLIEIGRARYPGVTFEQRDLRDGIDGEYDAVVALTLLMDVPDLAVIRPRLSPGGVLVATILHPAFFNQKTVDDGDGGYREVRGYLDEEEWWIESFGGHRHYHRPLGYYVEWIASLGLGVVELCEPSPTTYDGGGHASRRGWASRHAELRVGRRRGSDRHLVCARGGLVARRVRRCAATGLRLPRRWPQPGGHRSSSSSRAG